ncbi:GNAT family N-acetyltransferase [Metabacillus sp. Hm71]|uniref:GNAT family N-acetyltransferase n=1 Tax=Metabacillus sp. Hm71 TaxID=3450743 RepID=UPI003F42049C
MKINVRLATKSDAEALSVLNQEFNGGVRRTVTEIIDSLNQNSELVAVAFINDEAVGFACAQSFSSFCYHELQGEITEMYVRKSARRQGLATSMITLLEEKLCDRGVKEIKVLTGKTNAGAIKTYELSNYEIKNELMLYKEL